MFVCVYVYIFVCAYVRVRTMSDEQTNCLGSFNSYVKVESVTPNEFFKSVYIYYRLQNFNDFH